MVIISNFQVNTVFSLYTTSILYVWLFHKAKFTVDIVRIMSYYFNVL